MTNIIKLKPCPFCGNTDLCQFWTDGFHVTCSNCDTQVRDFESEEKCTEKWNTRTTVTTEK